jgi:hypothetical protein
MFWGAVLKNEEEYTLRTNNRTRTLRISHAALFKRGDKDKVMIQLSHRKKKFVIAILSANQNEFLNLNYCLTIDKECDLALSLINGQNTEVHISGYFENEENAINYSAQKEKPKVEKINEEENGVEEENSVESEEEGDEIDPGVDNDRLSNFLRRKVGKGEEMRDNFGKKLKKLDGSNHKISLFGTKEKPTLNNQNKNNFSENSSKSLKKSKNLKNKVRSDKNVKEEN